MTRHGVLISAEEPVTRQPINWPILHPPLWAASVPLAFYATDPGQARLWEVLLAVGVSTGLAVAATAALRLCYGTWRRAAWAPSWLVLMAFAFGFSPQVNHLLAHYAIPLQLTSGMQLAMWAVLTLGGLLWLNRPRQDERTCTLAANLMGIVMTAAPLLIAAITLASQPGYADEARFAENSETIRLQADDLSPDIYYVVLTGYGDAKTLYADFGFDNRPFLRELQERGFYLALDSRANYPETDLSLAATLNMHYHGDELAPRDHYRRQLETHRVGELLTSAGYRYHHFGGVQNGLRGNARAETSYQFSPAPSAYTQALWEFTVLGKIYPTRSPRGQEIEKFDLLEAAIAKPGPKFVFAQFQLPAAPWKFDSAGEAVNEIPGDRTEAENYRQQLGFTNQKILRTIDAILARSAQPPVIILQADQGPDFHYQYDRGQEPLALLRKRSGVLTALHLPARGRTANPTPIPATLSPVNTFRLVFRDYFAADLPLLADRALYWDRVNELGDPDRTQVCRFVDITEQLRASAIAAQ